MSRRPWLIEIIAQALCPTGPPKRWLGAAVDRGLEDKIGRARPPTPPKPGRTILELDDGKYGSARMAKAALVLQILV
jgi:hypothetical protein